MIPFILAALGGGVIGNAIVYNVRTFKEGGYVVEEDTKSKLDKIARKYSAVEYNEDNYSIGGGRDEVKFASRRHEDAKFDKGKLTLGEATALFKKATGMETDDVRNLIEYAVPDMEWHHAGKLPKSYGGGMKKTYFLNAEQITNLANNWDYYLEKFEFSKIADKESDERKINLEQKKLAFLKENAKQVIRVKEEPKYFYKTAQEMEGKYGWFDSSLKSYKLPEYFSGWSFESKDKLTEFNNLFNKNIMSKGGKMVFSYEEEQYEKRLIQRKIDRLIKEKKEALGTHNQGLANLKQSEINDLLEEQSEYDLPVSERRARGGAVEGEWVVYNPDTYKPISLNKSYLSAKMASNKLFSTGKYDGVGCMSKDDFEKTFKIFHPNEVLVYPNEISKEEKKERELPIDMDEVEKSAKYYTDELRWSEKPTVKKFEDEIVEYEGLKEQLDNHEIKPYKIIGSGYKPSIVRPLAYKWLNQRILTAKRAIEILEESGEKMAKGGLIKYANEHDSSRGDYKYISRPSSCIDNDVLDRVKHMIENENFIGNFGWRLGNGKLNDGYLYELDSYDKDFVRDIKLKDDERIFRYITYTTAIGGMCPFVKINLDKELLYFSLILDNEDLIFETKGIKPLWINLVEKKMWDYIKYRNDKEYNEMIAKENK